jgi:hypothetical protein
MNDLWMNDPVCLTQRFHETYERLAPAFGYRTREASAKPWSEVPAQNKQLMIAVCAELLSTASTRTTPRDEQTSSIQTHETCFPDHSR